jgi:hypothetical protein
VTASAEPEFPGPSGPLRAGLPVPGPANQLPPPTLTRNLPVRILPVRNHRSSSCNFKPFVITSILHHHHHTLRSPMTSPRAVSWREAPLTPSLLATPQSVASHHISPGLSASHRSSAMRTKVDAGGFLNFYADHDRSCASTHIMPHQATVSATVAGDSSLTGAQVSQARLPEDPQSSTLARIMHHMPDLDADQLRELARNQIAEDKPVVRALSFASSSLEPKDSRISPYQRKIQAPQSNEVEPSCKGFTHRRVMTIITRVTRKYCTITNVICIL